MTSCSPQGFWRHATVRFPFLAGNLWLLEWRLAAGQDDAFLICQHVVNRGPGQPDRRGNL